jgi:hypothetical protein
VTVLEREISRLPAGTGDQVMRRMRILPRAQHPFFDDPDGWAQEQLGVESWSKPRAIRESVRGNRHTAVPAAHDVAKSHTAASLACWWLETRPIGEAMVVSTAPRQHQVDSILWREIRSMHRTGGLSGRVLPGTARWYMGNDELVGFGRKTADEADPEQAMQAFQGIHARYVLVIIDEAGGVPKWLFDAADSLAANEHSRVLAIGNPDDPASHFAEICKPGTKWNVLPVSAFDSPRWTGEPVSERLLELLVSELYVNEMADLGEDSNLYQSKVLGQFPDVSDDALFPPRLLQRAIDQDLAGLDLGGYGVDVARFGADETCVYRNRAGVIRLVEAARKQDTEETADMVERILSTHGPDRVAAAIDAVGVGAGVYDKLRRRGMPVVAFGAGERALEPTRFVNRRAEMFWTLRQWMEDGLVDLDGDDKQLISQLGRMKFKQVAGNRIQIESKDEMRKRGVKSPDRADAAAMALMAPPAITAEQYALATAAGQTGDVGTYTHDLLDRAM